MLFLIHSTRFWYASSTSDRAVMSIANCQLPITRWTTNVERTGVEILCQQVVVMVANSVEETVQLSMHCTQLRSEGLNVRLVYTTITEETCGNFVDDMRQLGALLLDGHRVVEMLIAQILDIRCQVAEEDYRWNQLGCRITGELCDTYKRCSPRLPQRSRC